MFQQTSSALLALLSLLSQPLKTQEEASGPFQSILAAFAARDDFSGVGLVAVDGEVMFAGAHGLASREHGVANTIDTRFQVASIAKLFNAALILRLADQGKLKLDDTVGQHLAGLPAGISEGITIEQLLCHRGGLYRDTLTASHRSRREHYRPGELLEIIATQPLLSAPGAEYHYSSPGYVLLSAIASAATGADYQAAVRTHVLEPLGLENTGFPNAGEVIQGLASRYVRLIDEVVAAPYADVSFAPGAGDIYTTAGDLLCFGEALRAGPFLSAESRQKMLRDHGSRRGLGCFIGDYKAGPGSEPESGTVFGHDGGAPGIAAHLNIFVEHNVCTVVIANVTPCNPTDISNRLANAALLLGVDLPKPHCKTEVLRALLTADPRGELRRLGLTDRRHRPGFGELIRLAFAYHENHQPEPALRLANVVRQAYPRSALPHILIGRIEERRDGARALTAFQRALKLDPSSASAALGIERLKAGQARQQVGSEAR